MCDYSLHVYPNRLAFEGEELVVHRFGAGSLGLASPVDLAPTISANQTKRSSPWSRVKAWFLSTGAKWEAERRVPAVCIPPGARLRLFDIPMTLQRDLGTGEIEEVQFVETTAEVNTYRDGVRFGNHRQVSLQRLREGQRVQVLSLGVEEPATVAPTAWTTVV